MISNSEMLSNLFKKKQYNFLKDIDKILDEICEKKIRIDEKETGIKKLFESSKIEIEKNERLSKIIFDTKCKCLELERRIKELNQAIIRLIVDNESNYKYQTQNLKQTVCFIKDKIEEFTSLNKKFDKELLELDKKIENILENKTENDKISIEGNNNAKEKVEKTEPKKKKKSRRGSALNELEKIKKMDVSTEEAIQESIFEIEKKVTNEYNIENNILLISEKKGKVFLPYKKEDLQEYLLSYPEDYKSYSDVIEKEYILPLNIFMKNQTLSRFRETYELIRNREFKSMFEAMKVSTKFMFKYDLNPAIIAACNSKDELNEYMSCLEKNELEKFNIFDIKFELNLL